MNDTFSIVAWNINGIRSIPNLKDKLNSLNADIICLQETKISREDLESDVALIDGYTSYFSFSRVKSGYSGVATYCKLACTPIRAEEGITGVLKPPTQTDHIGFYPENPPENKVLKDIDSEGRALLTHHSLKTGDMHYNVVVANLYCPRMDPDKPERLTFRASFFENLEARVYALMNNGYYVILAGDLNVCHNPIDHCEPSKADFNTNIHKWLEKNLYNPSKPEDMALKLVDSYRYLHPCTPLAFTCWNTRLNARDSNFGTRIDYILIDSRFLSYITEASILSTIMGSDHCPVKAILSMCPIRSITVPTLCTRNYPEYVGRQVKLSQYFKKIDVKKLGIFQTHSKSLKTGATKRGKVSKTGTSKGVDKFFARQKKDIKGKSKPSTSTSQSPGSSGSAAASSSQMSITEIVLDSDPVPDPETGGTTTDCLVSLESISKNASFLGDSSFIKSQAAIEWKKMFKGPKPPPLCKGHGEACVLRTVKRKGPNLNRTFWVCPRGIGRKDDPGASCNHFQWSS